ncbi:CLPTM1-like membrane protein [Thraustotheca clavata]|uniref:CLPTM1-like membrane protein n=1 Tax=Thraustotheca clavata TaxID=74557 RepID=A0A1V9ZZA7_9STRA|nr:CLPTM1-like membrane protein [Thraustotheca clavata]
MVTPRGASTFIIFTLLCLLAIVFILTYMVMVSPLIESKSSPMLSIPITHKKIAYMLYATDSITACNALIMAKHIRRLGTPLNIPIVVLATKTISFRTFDAMEKDGSVKLIMVEPWYQKNARHATWSASLTKLRIFQNHGYDRVIYIDSDAWLHRNLDHLFALGEAVLWAPRAYYLKQPTISTALLVIHPSETLFKELEMTITFEHANDAVYDMDIVNEIWMNEYAILPSHYVVLNSDINSAATFGFDSIEERINATYLHHFSTTPDGNYGKPWNVNRSSLVKDPTWHPKFYALFEAYWKKKYPDCVIFKIAVMAADEAPEEAPSTWYYIGRALLIWYGVNKVTSYMWGNTASPSSSVPSSDVPSSPGFPAQPSGFQSFDPTLNPFHKFTPLEPTREPLVPHRNTFGYGVLTDIQVFATESPNFSFEEDTTPVWQLHQVPYAFLDESTEYKLKLNWTVSSYLRNNGTLYAHVFYTKSGYSPNPNQDNFDPLATVHKYIEMNTYRPRAKVVKQRNLWKWSQEDEKAVEEVPVEDDNTYLSHWKPMLTINALVDHTVYPRGQPPQPFVAPYLMVDPISGNYLPIIKLNEFWLLEEQLLPINATVETLPLEIDFIPIGITKFALYHQMEDSFRMQEAMGTSSKRDSDAMKKMFADTNPYLLGVTMIVSVLHTVFDMLAFKNDVSFWRKQKSLEGLSLRTVVLNAFFHLVIFLYLVDNDTSWMILFSSGLGVVLDFWKIKKAVKITRDDNGSLVFSGEDNYVASSTAEYDRIAVAHVSYIMYPLLVGYSLYKLVYSEHKGWYSWVLSSLTSFVYAFGFIMMTPQLYINYKLKSVAHLPWRAMVYKSLNTFIDDLFAFVITMPMMHRLACFRDDIIFFVYLYQRWIYRVDKSRINEFGQGGEEEPEAIEGPKTNAVQEGVKTTEESTEESTEKDGIKRRSKHNRN